MSCISTTGSGISLRASSTIISGGSYSPRWLPARVASSRSADDEDLIDQHVRYFLRHHPQAARSHTVTRISRGVYDIDGKQVDVEWQHHPIVGMPGHLVVVDGPLRQPLADYIAMSEANAEYDTFAVAKTSALHHVPKERRMTFDDSEGNYTRLEAMKVAKEQASIREQAADYAREGLQAPDDLVKKYNKNLRNKLGRNKTGSAAREVSASCADENRDPQVNRDQRLAKMPDEAVACSPEPLALRSQLLASPQSAQQALSPLRARVSTRPVQAGSWVPAPQVSYVPPSASAMTTPMSVAKASASIAQASYLPQSTTTVSTPVPSGRIAHNGQVWSYCGSPLVSGGTSATPAACKTAAGPARSPSAASGTATGAGAPPSYMPSSASGAGGGSAGGSAAGSVQTFHSAASYSPGFARFIALPQGTTSSVAQAAPAAGAATAATPSGPLPAWMPQDSAGATISRPQLQLPSKVTTVRSPLTLALHTNPSHVALN